MAERPFSIRGATVTIDHTIAFNCAGSLIK
jgi:hypothetical protein